MSRTNGLLVSKEGARAEAASAVEGGTELLIESRKRRMRGRTSSALERGLTDRPWVCGGMRIMDASCMRTVMQWMGGWGYVLTTGGQCVRMRVPKQGRVRRRMRDEGSRGNDDSGRQ